ncbi:MAG: hypothetical protein ACFFBC_00200 [Promethearchaeota archaeon]
MRKNRFQKTRSGKSKDKEQEEMDVWDLLLEASKLGLFPKMP